MWRSGRSLIENNDGAVAPTIALSLVALVAFGGIAFDYARLASMDTELQIAADQAALAAASQLDGGAGACARAANAAHSMVVNQTRMANDGNASGRTVTIPLEETCDATGQVRFYKDKDKTTAATTDADAKFVEITVDSRTARYALTPIVAAFSSGAVSATALAGLDSAICKVPPLMLCNPNEEDDEDFTIANYIGKGIRLVANDGGGDYAPGNFGFLDAGVDTAGGGANALRIILGRTALAANCVRGDGVTTDPGNMVSVRDALNTRFDIYDSGLNTACGNNAAQNAALCPPSLNARKDLLQDGNANQCGLVANGASKGWKEATNPYPGSQNPGGCDQNSPNNCFGSTGAHALGDTELSGLSPTGYPRDICHAFSVTGSCTDGRIGDGDWDRFAYFKSHQAVDYPEMASINKADTTAFNALLNGWFGKINPTRYEVYAWEMRAANRAARLHTLVSSGGLNASSQPVCAAPGITPSSSLVDRRVLTVAVVNCGAEDVHGRTSSVTVTKWIDVFLTEPTIARNVGGARTENSDVYIEVIGQTLNATDEGAVQLVKKSIPYLIE